jgi:predicted pyridoxine 5'-phosphate oxidase superfamily flavin-nucleotide-binding protein
VTSDDGLAVRISHGERVVAADDPVRPSLRVGSDVGALAIDLDSRRRLRVNGVLAVTSDARLELTVRESFPNCPKYIQRRERLRAPPASAAAPPERGDRLDAARRSFAASIDTHFVASRHPARGVDVSHRGGERGFVRVLDERTLRFPDYPGNGMFQTLGNFEVEPHAGVLMVDFERERFLSLTGRVTVSYGVRELDHPAGGTGRTWDLAVEAWQDFQMPSGNHFRLLETSPYNPLPFGRAPGA